MFYLQTVAVNNVQLDAGSKIYGSLYVTGGFNVANSLTVNNEITGFDRQSATPYEWANIALLPPGYCETGTGAVYERLSGDLPLPAAYVDSYEIDRPGDLDVAQARFSGTTLGTSASPSGLPPLVPGQRRRQPVTAATGRPFSR